MYDGRAVEILLVEDSPPDVRLTKEALKTARVPNRVVAVPDGEEALRYLRREGSHSGARRPDLILLDLKLPKLSGLELLKTIKEDADLRRIPVVVLTTSRTPEDICRSYGLHANSYIAKPTDLDQYLEAVRSIERFWLSAVTLPQRQ